MYDVKETVEVANSIEEERKIKLIQNKLVEGEILINESVYNWIKWTDNA
ncbi:MAG: hypothetical protein ACI91R_001444 [Vicingaceae bacterium]|jgi:hypothetical protein